MKKKYTVKYDLFYECVLIIDTEIFTDETARSLLEFFVWDYDKKACPILEYTKKIAAKVFALSNTHNEPQILQWFEDSEGYPHLDGRHGIQLGYYDDLEIDPLGLFVKVE